MGSQPPPDSPATLRSQLDPSAEARSSSSAPAIPVLKLGDAGPQTRLNDTTLTAQVEYEQANEWWRQLSNMRRQDLAMFTTIQGAALTIIGDRLLSLDPRSLALSIVAFLVALIGLNNERRIYAYLDGFRNRALELESAYGASLVTRGMKSARETRFLLRTQWAFGSYYALLAAGWLLIWILNV